MNAIIFQPHDFDRFVNEMKTHLTKEVEAIKTVVVEKPMGVKEAAAYLGISERTLHSWRNTGHLPESLAHKINGSTYFFPSELRDYIKKS